jgi:ADP-ribosyl-[dinitrogen reductase] hydrolase
MPDLNHAERCRGALLGLAAGDAVGTTLEFKPRGSFEPIDDLQGGGPFGLNPGQWTDDTSMALCLGYSLVERGGFDAADQMDRYIRWMNEGYLSSTGTCFDIGDTVRAALVRYQSHGDPYAGDTNPRSAGNGAIMRLAPIPIFYYADPNDLSRYAIESTRTTHGAEECVEASVLFAHIIHRALSGATKEDILFSDVSGTWQMPKIAAIAAGSYRDKGAPQVFGTGYVVQSLEAALWCFHTSGNFREAILRAANLGDDADTTAAICGQIAGAHYGFGDIPVSWRRALTMREDLLRLADRLAEGPTKKG